MKDSKRMIFSTEVTELLHELEDLDEKKQLACSRLYTAMVIDDSIWSYLVIGRRHRYMTKEGYNDGVIYPEDPRHPSRNKKG